MRRVVPPGAANGSYVRKSNADIPTAHDDVPLALYSSIVTNNTAFPPQVPYYHRLSADIWQHIITPYLLNDLKVSAYKLGNIFLMLPCGRKVLPGPFTHKHLVPRLDQYRHQLILERMYIDDTFTSRYFCTDGTVDYRSVYRELSLLEPAPFISQLTAFINNATPESITYNKLRPKFHMRAVKQERRMLAALHTWYDATCVNQPVVVKNELSLILYRIFAHSNLVRYAEFGTWFGPPTITVSYYPLTAAMPADMEGARAYLAAHATVSQLELYMDTCPHDKFLMYDYIVRMSPRVDVVTHCASKIRVVTAVSNWLHNEHSDVLCAYLSDIRRLRVSEAELTGFLISVRDIRPSYVAHALTMEAWHNFQYSVCTPLVQMCHGIAGSLLTGLVSLWLTHFQCQNILQIVNANPGWYLNVCLSRSRVQNPALRDLNQYIINGYRKTMTYVDILFCYAWFMFLNPGYNPVWDIVTCEADSLVNNVGILYNSKTGACNIVAQHSAVPDACYFFMAEGGMPIYQTIMKLYAVL